MTTVAGLPTGEGALSPSAPRAQTRRHGWPAFLLRRFSRLLVSVWVLITASFAVVYLAPGDPVTASLGPLATAQQIAQRRNSLGLNHPLVIQYWDYITRLLHGDLGQSWSTGFAVSQVIEDRLSASASLGGLAFLVVIVVSIPAGVVLAILTYGGQHRALEFNFTAVTGLLNAVPTFLLGVGLVYLFGITFPIFPVGGREGLASYVLPVAALAAGATASLARIVRVEALTVLEQDYMRTARSKRLPARLVYLRHALPNLLTSALTIGGLLLTDLLAGSVLVENIFAWPGLGLGVANAIEQKDYPLIQAFVLIYGVAVLLVNLAVDLALAVLNPRSTILET